MCKIIVAMSAIAAYWLAGDISAASCTGPQRVSSGPSSVTIVELYTSEGCDSCPPADKWFSTLNAKKDGVVPLAFHVDYWDYIGWKDRFAKPAFSERQRDAVRRQGGRTSYTPQVMLNGKDQRSWSFFSLFTSNVKSIVTRAPRANLALEFTPANAGNGGLDTTVTAMLPQISDRADLAVFLAITENNLFNRVTAGENRGSTLKHDHVVRTFLGPLVDEASERAEGKWVIKRPIALPPDWKRADMSLIAFLQNLRSGEVYQALSTPLCASL